MNRDCYWVLVGFMAIVACNDVPVRNLTSSYEVQVQAVRERGKPAKLDILWVVDDSPSMCQEQQSLAASFEQFLKVFQSYTAIDMRLAVTTTAVCSKDKPNPGRGKFVYQPALDTTMSPECVEKQVRPCLDDSDCQKDASLPNSKNWVCEKKPATYMYSCDKPAKMCAPEPNCDNVDKLPGDLLMVVQSMCRYSCDREADPAGCGKVFGPILDGKKSYNDQPCDHVCSGGQCSVEACEAEPLLVGTSGITNDKPECKEVCASDWDCVKKCVSFLYDEGKCKVICEAPSSDCYSTCTFAGTEEKGYADKMFPRKDFLCSLVCDKGYDCKDICIAEFAKSSYRCLYPGGDKTKSGCLLPPPTSYCPAKGPKILDKGDFNCCLDPQSSACADHKADTSVTCSYFKGWKSGDWAGNPVWKTLSDAEVYEQIFRQLFICMAMVGTGQQPCGNQEQGLLAAWLALDPNGENKDQARAFLREDAYLLIVVISDEEDCSTVKQISAEQYPLCACLADTRGCRADGTCNPNYPDKVLYPVDEFVNKFKSLKKDPAMVVFTAIVGDALPGSVLSPKLPDGSLPEVDDIRRRYYDCKCQTPATAYSPQTYVCYSNQGKADLGKRYMDVAAAFGNRWGQTSNICDDSGLSPALERIAKLVVPLLTQVCLPRPLARNEFIEVYKYKASDPLNRVLLMPDTETETRDYRLYASPIGCIRFRVTDQDCSDQQGRCVGFEGDCRSKCSVNNLSDETCEINCQAAFTECNRVCECWANCPAAGTEEGDKCRSACDTVPENSIIFTEALQADDRLEIRYLARPGYGQ